MADFKKVYYQDVWGETYIVEIDEKAIADSMAEGNSEVVAILVAADEPIRDDMVFKLMEDQEYAKRYIADAKKVAATTGNFGEGYEGMRAAEEVLAAKDTYIALLDDASKYLDRTHPNVTMHDSREAQNEVIFNICTMALCLFPCWKIVGYEK